MEIFDIRVEEFFSFQTWLAGVAGSVLVLVLYTASVKRRR
jgi:hypothetical protein